MDIVSRVANIAEFVVEPVSKLLKQLGPLGKQILVTPHLILLRESFVSETLVKLFVHLDQAFLHKQRATST